MQDKPVHLHFTRAAHLISVHPLILPLKKPRVWGDLRFAPGRYPAMPERILCDPAKHLALAGFASVYLWD
nr:hypothetical protein [Mucilaginibacter sp. SP1R1]